MVKDQNTIILSDDRDKIRKKEPCHVCHKQKRFALTVLSAVLLRELTIVWYPINWANKPTARTIILPFGVNFCKVISRACSETNVLFRLLRHHCVTVHLKKHDVYLYKIILEYIFLEPQGHAEEPGEELEKY